MALDHYVSQVHLRRFYSPVLGERMYAMRKRDGKRFTPNSESVCRIEDGSTNSYLAEDRAIEEFLKGIEPKYNTAVDRIIAGEINHEEVYIISGFVAYVMTCSPTAMRLQSSPLKSLLEVTARALDARGAFPPPPASLGGESFTDLIDAQKVVFRVDPKYPQAIGISNVQALTARFGNSYWEILHNRFDDSPFFTSDNPAAIERTQDVRILNRVVPLTPTLAVRIRPDIGLDANRLDTSFQYFRFRYRKPSRGEISAINRLIAQAAEDLVFFRDDSPWVAPFIAKYSKNRVQALVDLIPTKNGTLQIARQRIV